MDYIGEHLLPGQLGNFFIILSLVATGVATVSYFMSVRSSSEEEAKSWKKLARWAFITECVSVFAIFGLLFYIISNHLFEYHYAWKHSSRSLEVKYLLACFWEGQEGSFLLWSVWHCVIGLIIIPTAKKWEAPVMTVLSFAQFILATMLAGLYFFGQKFGSNPFMLLRDSGVLDNAPALHLNFDVNQAMRPDYLNSIKDGNDLNPLLQNYWMVIHPPVLFLGFATTIVPFAFAISGLWLKKGTDWIKQALPWALFSAAVLGVGIMMGAAWAYESLTFGGYWAWDPVENASLVPWLVMIAGIHTLLIYKHSAYSLRSTYIFFIISFIMVLYSTFLTRSGILGETSVHAFTDLGMNLQLYLFLYLFIWISAFAAARDAKQRNVTMIVSGVLLAVLVFFPNPIVAFLSMIAGLVCAVVYVQKNVSAVQKEESASSREFWMFIGSLVFFLSAMVIIFKTSMPVYNKVFGTSIAPPEDPEYSYNNIQMYVAIIIGLLTAVTQYFKYKDTDRSFLIKKLMIPTIITLVICGLLFAYGQINYHKKGPIFHASIWLALAASIYAIVANASYIFAGLRGKLRLAGGSVAHVGFGMVLAGILVTSSNKEVISNNLNGIPVPLGPNEDPRENLTLVQGVPSNMGKYTLTYLGDSAHPRKQEWYYKVLFNSVEDKESFTLLPDAFVNYKGREGLMANPSARHYWDHDIFTFITSLPNPDVKDDTVSFKPHTLKAGDTVFYSKGYMVMQEIQKRDSLPENVFGKDGSLHEIPIKIYSKTGSIYTVTSRLARARGEFMALPDTIPSESLILQMAEVSPDNTTAVLGVKESDNVMKYVTLKAFKYPYINLLWLGVLVTAFGIMMSVVRRVSLNIGRK